MVFSLECRLPNVARGLEIMQHC